MKIRVVTLRLAAAFFSVGLLVVLAGQASSTSLTLSPTSATSIPIQSYAAIRGESLQTDSSGNPLDLGNMTSGSFVTYSLTVPQAGNYAVTLSYSSPGNFGWGNFTAVSLLVNNTKEASITFPSTGSWTTYVNATPATIALPSGTVNFEILAQYTGYNLSGITFTPLSVSPQAATPIFSPVAGTYSVSETVAISDATSGAAIYYTTNGTTPTTSSAVYSTPIIVSASETLNAIAAASGYTNSAIGTAAYVINLPTPQAATPAFTPVAGTYTSVQTVTISTTTPSATIYYTTNGTAPSTSSPMYSGPITVSASETVEAIATASGDTTSAVGPAIYVINLPLPTSGPATPTFSPRAGTYSGTQTVTISDVTPGVTIYYTTNGTTPTTLSNAYSGPITVSSSETLQAIAVASSTVGSAAYAINQPPQPLSVANPSCTPAGGSFTSSQTANCSTTTTGASLYYTTNGSTPNCTPAGTPYAGAITVVSSLTLNVIGCESGYTPSGVMSYTFAINIISGSTTTVNISDTVETAGIDRPGINLGGVANYGSQQLLKSLNYSGGGYFPGTYFGTTFSCSSGTQTATSWYNNIADSSGFPANFWNGASFVAINAATGKSYGSGTITASTSNVSSGANFTLSPAISSACSPSNNDVLIVRLNAQNTLEPPTFVLNGNVCPGAAWDVGDTSPASTNTYQSLKMPTGCGLTFYIDATVSNRMNTNASLAAQQTNFINLNGSYNATFKAKCAVAGCSVTFNLGRFSGPAYIGSTTVNPSNSATNGAGWTTYTYPFTGSETGSQSSTLGFSFSCTGTCLLQDADVIEESTLAGNTTVFRDAVVWELEQLHPGSIRYMDASQWCSDVADEIATTGNRRWCGASAWAPQFGQPIGYNDVLALGNVVGSDVLISVGQLNGPSDWAMLINWLNTSGWISTYTASGHKIYLEDGNENWNPVSASIYNGNGTAYGYTLGLNMAAARAASGYYSGVIKLVGNSWVAPNQGYGQFGWLHNTLATAQSTGSLPDYVDNAPYMLNYLGAFNTSGSNISTTGAPFLDEWAEDENVDSVVPTSGYPMSMYLNAQYASQTYGVGTLVYEVNESTTNGITATQAQLDQVNGSVGNALSTMEHVLLMQRDSGVKGPIHVFTLAEPYTGYTCGGCNALVTPLWGANLLMSTGPGQTAGSANVDRPLDIGLRVINNAIGSNSNLMSVTQSGTPTFSYTAAQDNSGTPTILANSAVPYVNCFAYSNGTGNWTTICFNNNLTTAESVTLSGLGAPTGSVSETTFPNASNVITDNNENTFLGASSVAPVVVLPSAAATSGTSYSIPPASMIVLTYTVN